MTQPTLREILHCYRVEEAKRSEVFVAAHEDLVDAAEQQIETLIRERGLKLLDRLQIQRSVMSDLPSRDRVTDDHIIMLKEELKVNEDKLPTTQRIIDLVEIETVAEPGFKYLMFLPATEYRLKHEDEDGLIVELIYPKRSAGEGYPSNET